VPLKTKVERWKVHFLLRIYEKPHVQHLSEWMTYYSWYVTGNVGVALEYRSYNKLNPSPKAYCFSKIDELKPFLVAWDPCLTFLSTALSFTPNQVYSLVLSIIKSYRCGVVSTCM
jgi:hypothetical protein